jgi:chitinase
MNPRKLLPTVLVALSALMLLVGSMATVAVAAPLYTITVTYDAAKGSVTLDPYKPDGYAKNNIVKVTATPYTGYTFQKWGGALSGTQNPATLRVAGNATITATFVDSSSGGGTSRPALPTSKMIVGYFAQWAIYQRGYLVKNVDTSGAAAAMNVMNYAFAAPDANLRCASLDTFADYGKAFSASESVDGIADTSSQPLKGNFNQILKLKAKHPQLRVLLSLGGWSQSYRFSTVARSENRANFVKSCIDTFMRGNVAGVFDGFDIDWEYPGSCGLTCDWSQDDWGNFPALLQEFRVQLDAFAKESPATATTHYLVTVAAPAGAAKYNAMNLAAMHVPLDWINVMAYDFHGSWEPNGPTNHAAALHKSSCESVDGDWGDKAIQAYIDAGVPPGKLLLGVPFYGHGWRGVAAVNDGLCQPAAGLARGVYERGTNDFKVLDGQKGTEYSDSLTATHWSFNGSEFWSFDDTDTMQRKADYVNNPTRPLRGMMFWELSGDTVGDTNGGRLVKAMRSSLGEPPVVP